MLLSSKLLHFLKSLSYKNDSISSKKKSVKFEFKVVKKLKQIVDRATAENVEVRTNSITELIQQLELLQGKRVNEKTRERHLNKRIAVIGADQAVGTTYVAMKICRYLNKNRVDSFYQDMKKDSVHMLWRNLKEVTIKKGVLYHKSFKGLLNYGEIRK